MMNIFVLSKTYGALGMIIVKKAFLFIHVAFLLLLHVLNFLGNGLGSEMENGNTMFGLL